MFYRKALVIICMTLGWLQPHYNDIIFNQKYILFETVPGYFSLWQTGTSKVKRYQKLGFNMSSEGSKHFSNELSSSRVIISNP